MNLSSGLNSNFENLSRVEHYFSLMFASIIYVLSPIMYFKGTPIQYQSKQKKLYIKNIYMYNIKNREQ